MQKRSTRKLSFTKASLRQLAQTDLTRAAGGGSNAGGTKLCSGCAADNCLTLSKNYSCEGGTIIKR